MSAWSTYDIATRLATLIRNEDAGDREQAARRLRLPQDELERFLANESGPPSAVFLAAVVRAYGADACWLITGERDIRSAHLSGGERSEVAELLLAVANVLLDPYWARRATPAMPTVSATNTDSRRTKEPSPLVPPRVRDES